MNSRARQASVNNPGTKTMFLLMIRAKKRSKAELEASNRFTSWGKYDGNASGESSSRMNAAVMVVVCLCDSKCDYFWYIGQLVKSLALVASGRSVSLNVADAAFW